MNTAFNWATLQNGATFHSLVNILLLHDDPKTIVFTKEGPDGGLDAVSPLWSTAYQAKFHAAGKASKAFADARAEAKKAEEYRTAGHARYDLWKDVTTWKLVTNVPFGPDEAKQWDDEIKPLFKALGIDAEWMTLAALEERLAKHPDVAQCFFEGKARSWISLEEFRQRSADGILGDPFAPPLEMRQAEIDRVLAFTREPDTRILVADGPGGVGKTRFLYEAALRASASGLFGAVYVSSKTAERSAEWYRGIVAEVPALVLIDEPQDPAFIESLLDQLRTRAKAWKVIVAVRSPNHPVLKPLRSKTLPILSTPPLELRPLPAAGALTMATNLLRAHVALEPAEEALAAAWLAKVSGRVPIWITVGVRLLKDRGALGELPSDQWGLAETYLDEIVRRGPENVATPAQLTWLLRWISVLQPVARNDKDMMTFLASEAGFAKAGDLERALQSLQQRKVVVWYGVDDRLVEIRPDVMRDYIVRQWLTHPVDPADPAGARTASADATDLVKRMIESVTGGAPVPAFRQAVITLGRLEFEVEPKLNLLDPLADAVLDAANGAKDALEQRQLLAIAETFGPFRPRSFAATVKALRLSDVPSGNVTYAEGLTAEVNRERVLSALPWSLFEVAHYATTSVERRAILEELEECVELEAKNASAGIRRPNDGKSAEALLPRLLGAERSVRTSYLPEGAALVDDMLDELEVGHAVSPARARVFLGPLLSVKTEDSHAEGDQFVIDRGVLFVAGAPGKKLVERTDRLWKALDGDKLDVPTRLLVWELLAAQTAIASSERHRPEMDDNGVEVEAQEKVDPAIDWTFLVRTNLERARDLARAGRFTQAEWFAARKVWDWHAEHDWDEACAGPAKESEALFRADPIRGQLAELLLEYHSHEPLASVARDLAARDAPLIEDFFAKALEFVADSKEDWRRQLVRAIALNMGELDPVPEAVRRYASDVIVAGASHPQLGLALAVVGARLDRLRAAGDTSAVETELAAVITPETAPDSVRAIIRHLYIEALPAAQARLTALDLAVLEKHRSLFAEDKRIHFVLLGLAFTIDPNVVKPQAHTAFTEAFDADPWTFEHALAHFLHGMEGVLIVRGRAKAPLRQEDYEWIVELTSWLPESHELRSMYQLDQLSQGYPKFTLSWLGDLVEARRKRLAEVGRKPGEDILAKAPWVITRNFAFADLATPIAAEGAISEADRGALERLLALADDGYLVSSFLPDLMRDLDPHGHVVPSLVKARLATLKDPSWEDIAKWAAYGKKYHPSSDAWREVARAACRLAEARLDQNETEKVYSHLSSFETGVLKGKVGEVHGHWRDVVEAAKKALAEEGDGPLRGLLAWRLHIAERQLKHEHERLEEEGYLQEEGA